MIRHCAAGNPQLASSVRRPCRRGGLFAQDFSMLRHVCDVSHPSDAFWLNHALSDSEFRDQRSGGRNEVSRSALL